MKSKIECPVCLAINTEGPMASCPNGHLLCLPCHQVMLAGALVNCPNCREPMGNNMNWLAKTLIENIEHECNNEGCKEKLAHKEVARHREELCQYRKVMCPSNSSRCRAFPFLEVFKHVKTCAGVKILPLNSGTNNQAWPLQGFHKYLFDDNHSKLISDISQQMFSSGGRSFCFITSIFQIHGEVFALQWKMVNSNFLFSVLMLAEREKCERFKITLEIQNNNCKTGFSAQFNPEPVDMKPFDQAIFMIHKDRFEKMGTKCGDKFKFKIEMKVSEKREPGEEIQ